MSTGHGFMLVDLSVSVECLEFDFVCTFLGHSVGLDPDHDHTIQLFFNIVGSCLCLMNELSKLW
jgi:hypothetical protein